MNIIKFILGALGLVFGVIIALWVVGVVWSIAWYLLFFGVVGALGYGGYKLFLAAERKALSSDPHNGLGGRTDIDMSWDEYERKYLQK